MSKRIGKNDLIFILSIILAGAVFCAIFYGVTNKAGDSVTVTVDGELFGKYPLDEDATVEITDKEGQVTNYLTIQDGKADMTDANCPDRLCVNQSAISKDKETIVCLPNKVVVTVESTKKADLDAVAN